MADISKITVENTTYFVKDTVARGHGCFVTTDAPTNVSGQYVWSKASLKPYSVDPQGIIEYKNHYYEIQPDQSTSTAVTANYVTSLPAPPSGGSTGQVLAKASASDYDFEWVNQSGGGGSFEWTQVAQTTNQATATIDLSSYSEVMIVADVLRNSAHHIFSTTVPIQLVSSTAYEYKLGGYVGNSLTAASGGAWASMSLTSFHGVGAYINGTSMQSGSYSTTWTVYAR